ncbi:MAG: zinc ribbon domain-containing protein [Actinomycetota bacterium]
MSGYLADGLPVPVPARDGLDAPFWSALAEGRLVLQRCEDCGSWQWGPEWICHTCHSFNVGWQETEPRGVIYSHERVWHPVHPALKEQGPFVIVLVELSDCDGVRMVGNLLGDPMQDLVIGTEVTGVFEHHPDHDPPYTLLHWKV